MLTLPKTYDYKSKLNIKRSRSLSVNSLPKSDATNWLFLVIGERRFSFIYKITEPDLANYDEPFSAYLSFTFIELAGKMIEANKAYTVMRGEEIIGIVEIIASVI